MADCLAIAADGDAILLLGDGVYCALADSAAASILQDCAAEHYYLAEDARARSVQELIAGPVQAVDMDGFVALSERFSRQQAWY